MKTSLVIENLPVSKLLPHELNPRKHSKKQIKQIAESIRTFGFRVPVLIDANDRLICGHGRLAACRLLGISSVPAIRAGDWDEAKIRAFMIADNRLTENSEWDDSLLAENFKFLGNLKLDFEIDITGFDYGEIEQFLIDDEASPSGEIPPPDHGTLPRIAAVGDVWLLGKHRIVCGDSRDPAVYAALFPDQKKASIVFTDPPYNLPARDIGQSCEENHGDFVMGAGEMSPEQFTQFLTIIFRQLTSHSVDGSIHYICMDWRHSREILSAGAIYDDFKNLCVWTKHTGGMGTFYRSQHELIFVFKSGKGKHQNHFKLGQHGRYRTNVWNYPSVMSLKEEDGDKGGTDALRLHPTIKPVALIEDALYDCSRRDEIVLDVFLGSGSTLIAADKTDRICYGIELSPRYVDAAITRWQDWTGKDAIHADSGCTYNDLKLI